MNAAQTLLQAGAPQAIALECGAEHLSYAALRQRVRQAAGAWAELGLQRGQRVIVLAPDSIEWVVAYLGVIWAGGVAIGVNPRLPMAELAPILAESEIRFVWCEADSVAALALLLPGIAPAPILVVGGEDTRHEPIPEDWPGGRGRGGHRRRRLQPAAWLSGAGR